MIEVACCRAIDDWISNVTGYCIGKRDHSRDIPPFDQLTTQGQSEAVDCQNPKNSYDQNGRLRDASVVSLQHDGRAGSRGGDAILLQLIVSRIGILIDTGFFVLL